MKEILQPAIDYANDGFPVSEIIAQSMARNARVLKKYPGFKETYMPNGSMPAKGEIFKNPDLGNTLSIIAEKGRDAFYEGEIARTIDKYMKENGGFLSYDDLKNHKSEWVDPVSTNYRGYDVWELPPNGQGIAALQMLNILEAYDISAMGFGSPEYLHLLVEAKKLAFEDRAKFYADPDFNEIPVDWLISKDYADQRRPLINSDRAAISVDPGVLNSGETVYMTVADGEGNMISLIQSNYSGMGSGMTPTGLGFVLQDRGALFNLEEGNFNTYEPNKRPFHTIIPSFITKDGAPFISFGVMGGAFQPQGHVQIVVNMIDFGMELQEAGDAPRINHNGSSQPTGEVMSNGGVILFEPGFPAETIRELMYKGHKLSTAVPGVFGGYQAIMLIDGVYYGASESRKDGHAAGY
jgi:gamma-glutamyltranspeptidase/glutathione hydrolase